MPHTIIHNVRLLDAENDCPAGWLEIKDARISDFGYGAYPGVPRALNVIDGQGAVLMPGVIDEHVHFREPGFTHKGDIASESAAAAAGGVTTFFDMPNTLDATVTQGFWEQKMATAALKSHVNYAFFIGATTENIKFLQEADYRLIPGIKLFLGSTTGTGATNDPAFLERLFAETEAVIAVHAEDEEIIARCRERITRADGTADPAVDRHPLIRPAEACERATAMMVELANRHSHRLHVMHVSTAAELSYFSPGPVGQKLVTSETCPQYLYFDSTAYHTLGTRIKCNPAIKSPDQREAITAALFSSVIDTVATDHAPHLLSEKEGGALKAASGMPGVQFSLPLMLSLARKLGQPLTAVSRLMSANPAAIWKIDRRGLLRKGWWADLVLVSEHPETPLSDDSVMSRCRWTPYAGTPVTFSVKATWVNGRKIYADGNIIRCLINPAVAVQFNH